MSLSRPRSLLVLTLLACAALASPALARESLGLYGGWGAFRDPLVPRCYAIAMAEPSAMSRDYQPYAAIGTWPRRGTRNQVHLRLSRQLSANAPVTLRIGGRRIVMTAGGGDAWPRNDADNAAIIAAMRSSASMTASARDAKGRPFANTWALPGAASAMDAALIGCAKLR
ncbi:hypothetical protein [Novosphingobium sp. AP12]|uniref:hypothetical protein n=1 Tax=Novosphingobium sp. AP12 TaxID=1144305 RepID=UPI000271F5C0|nr:hypothetical protein [Novosphingobium sp. AP12]EJL34290.1 hypothetical protein PMI02_00719 [Novosphingobium sp. AP12]